MIGFWSVVQTETQREHFVRMMLMREGYLTYMPRIRVKKRIVPLFPSYIFALVIDRWYPIKNTIGVTQVLLAGDQPARVPDSVIASIKRLEVGGIVRLPKPAKLLQPGGKVQITSGSFAGTVGIYEGASSKHRERVLLELLGRSVPVDVNATDVRPLNVAR